MSDNLRQPMALSPSLIRAEIQGQWGEYRQRGVRTCGPLETSLQQRWAMERSGVYGGVACIKPALNFFTDSFRFH